MFKSIFQYELKQWLRSLLFYGFNTAFLLLAFVMMIGTAGYFDGPPATEQKWSILNTPFELSFVGLFFFKMIAFLLPVIVGNTIYRDYNTKTYAILYAYPIGKKDYFLGKAVSGFLSMALIVLALGAGILAGELFVGPANPRIGQFNPLAYLIAFGVYLLPNVIIVGLMVFTIVGVTRNIFSGFILVGLLMLFQLIIENVLFSNTFLLGLLDPFGQNAFQLATLDWDLDLRNAGAIPVNQLVVFNRLFWLAISLAVFGAYYRKFDFHYHPIWQRPGRGKRKKQIGKTKKTSEAPRTVSFDFSLSGKIKSFHYLARYDYWSILKDWKFFVLTGVGILTIFFIQLRVTHTGEFNLLPFTRILIGAPLKIYSLLILFATFIFSGLLVHKTRSSQMNGLVDVTPVSSWQLLGTKLAALAGMQITLLCLFLICGVAIQCFSGYYHFEWGLYCFQLFVLYLPFLLIWAIASLFVYTLVPHLFTGLFLLLLLWFGVDGLEQFGMTTRLLKFNKMPDLVYSDFNGFGEQLSGFFQVMGYWSALSILLLLLTFLLWNRGVAGGFINRVNQAITLATKPIVVILLLSAFGFFTLGFNIYRQEDASVGVDLSSQQWKQHLDHFKNRWKEYARLPPPKIKAIDLTLDLYPRENRFQASGTYFLVNKNATALDTLLIRTGFDERTRLNWDREATLIDRDSLLKYNILKLRKPLQPGDSMQLHFHIQSLPNTVFTKNNNVLYNGTFLKHDILPRLEYQFEDELPAAGHPETGRYHYFNKDADKVTLRTAISTSADQEAIAPGSLISQVVKDGRSYFVYATKEPVKFNFSFHSGTFQKTETTHQGVLIKSYAVQNHHHNISSMIDGLKAALDFHAKWFGPYPNQPIRIVEFPHTEERFSATLTANNIPSSEILFTINEQAMADKLNLPFYVMAHELTHQWFGNEVMPARAKGAKMLTESITEYITLCVYREKLGEDLADQFLQLQHRRYWKGKRKETKTELPLNAVAARQEYISYGKGTIALNTLAHYIGQAKMIGVLRTFMETYRAEPNAYPTTADFIQLLRANTPPEYHHLIIDLFESTTHYDFELVSAQALSGHEAELAIRIQKFDRGKTIALAEKEVVEIGQINEEGKLVKVDAVYLTGNETSVTLRREKSTDSFVIDPHWLCLDVDRGNNGSVRFVHR